MSEVQLSQLKSTILQNINFLPLAITLDIVIGLFIFLYRRNKKLFIGFTCVLITTGTLWSAFLFQDKNQFHSERQMSSIVKSLKNRNKFKNKRISVDEMNFFIGNPDRQSSIKIFASFSKEDYIYRPYSPFVKWKKNQNQKNAFKTDFFKDADIDNIDKLHLEKVIPKVFESAEAIADKHDDKYKGISFVYLEQDNQEINDKYYWGDWSWIVTIENRQQMSSDDLRIRYDKEGNLMKIGD
ncbi:hypothetical protein ABE945_12815 [Enterococcus gilvus]|uniref:hypothetical protein n=1 Tax=Enterococcus gilvus TaxID=160453 RepID=UPI003D6B3F32